MSASVKHLPATPLPWRASADGIVGQRSLLTVATGVKFLDDRDYASHAGNAYPRTVVVVRDAIRRIQNGLDKEAEQVLEALLAEFGEDL